MTAPDKFGFCASNCFTNHVIDPNQQFSLAGFLVVDWSVIYPDQSEMVIPTACEQKKEYLPGQEIISFWDYSEMAVGYPSFSIVYQAVEGPEVQQIFQEYDKAFNHTQSRVWLTYYRMETGTWEFTSGVMEEPIVQNWSGDAALTLTLNFGRLGFHLNSIANDYPTGPGLKEYVITKDMFSYFLFNNEDFRNANWNY